MKGMKITQRPDYKTMKCVAATVRSVEVAEAGHGENGVSNAGRQKEVENNYFKSAEW